MKENCKDTKVQKRRVVGLKYNIFEYDSLLLIEMSGDPKKNESLFANKTLLPYLKKKNSNIIVDLKKLHNFDPITLVGILNSIRKETNLFGGCLRLCSLSPEMRNYFRENRLDHVFRVYKNKEDAKKEH